MQGVGHWGRRPLRFMRPPSPVCTDGLAVAVLFSAVRGFPPAFWHGSPFGTSEGASSPALSCLPCSGCGIERQGKPFAAVADVLLPFPAFPGLPGICPVCRPPFPSAQGKPLPSAAPGWHARPTSVPAGPPPRSVARRTRRDRLRHLNTAEAENSPVALTEEQRAWRAASPCRESRIRQRKKDLRRADCRSLFAAQQTFPCFFLQEKNSSMPAEATSSSTFLRSPARQKRQPWADSMRTPLFGQSA